MLNIPATSIDLELKFEQGAPTPPVIGGCVAEAAWSPEGGEIAMRVMLAKPGTMTFCGGPIKESVLHMFSFYQEFWAL